MRPFSPPESARIRQVADGLAPALAAFESLCLDVGQRLGGAAPGLNALSGLLASVSDELLSPAMVGANGDLAAAAIGIARFSELLGSEEKDIRTLEASVAAIGAQVDTAQACARTLGALVFSLRIEAAQWSGRNADMMDFAKSLQDLVARLRGSLNDYAAAHTALNGRLRAASTYLAAFKQKHAAQMAQLAEAVEKSMAILSDRRLHAAKLLADVAAQSRAIGDNIGECVAALQIGDSTRQRAEHVARALTLAADAVETPLGEVIPDVEARYDGDRGRLAHRILELQSRQVAGARLDFAQETARIVDLVARLDADARAVAQRGLRLFGSDEAEDASFLQTLERDLSAAREVVEEGASTRADVDDAKQEVAETVLRLEAQIEALSAIASEVSMIGTNASLRSSRLGDEGKGVTLIAAELRDLGRQISTATDGIAFQLSDIGMCMRRFSFVRGVDASSLAELGSQVSRTAQSFGAAGRNVAEALKSLRAETTRAHDELEVAGRALKARGEAGDALAEAETDIAGIAAALPPSGMEQAEADRFLDAVLGPIYTMVAERRIHGELTGAFAEAMAQEAEPTAAEADAVML